MPIDDITTKHLDHQSGLRRHRQDDEDGFKERHKARVEKIEDEIEEKKNNPGQSSSQNPEQERDPALQSQENRILVEWQAPEFIYTKKNKTWYIILAIIFAGLVTFGILSGSFITSLTFIILFIVIYLYAQRKPEETYFAITLDGVIYDDLFFPYENIQGFWVEYEPGNNTALHLHIKRLVAPKVTVQITDQNPVEIRRILIKEIPEDDNLADGLTEQLSRRVGF